MNFGSETRRLFYMTDLKFFISVIVSSGLLYPLKDETQTALFEDPVRTAL